jgi:hypothetical protein
VSFGIGLSAQAGRIVSAIAGAGGGLPPAPASGAV